MNYTENDVFLEYHRRQGLNSMFDNFMFIHENIDFIFRCIERANIVFEANYITCKLYQELGFL